MSADPLAVHAPGEADLNVYAYVKGAVLKAIDPIGLQDQCPNGSCHEATDAAPSPVEEIEAATPSEDEQLESYLEGIQAQQELEAAEAETAELERKDQEKRAAEGRPATSSYGVECSGDCHQENVVQAPGIPKGEEDTPLDGSLAPLFVHGLPILASEALTAGLAPSLEMYLATRVGMRMPRFGETGTAIANQVPQRMARVVPAEFADGASLGAPNAVEAWVTAADDLAGLSTAESVAQRLTLVDDAGELIGGPRAIIEFDAVTEGLASPVFRTTPGFVGGGRTAGGAREFVLPNLEVDSLTNVTIRIVE